MDPEAPREIAKATGELAKFGTKELEFLEKLVGPHAEQVGGLVADKIAFLRAKRRITMCRVLELAQQQLEERGQDLRPVPAKTLVPLLAESSLEDGTTFRERIQNPTGLIGQTNTAVTQLFPKNSILFLKVVDRTLLGPVDPAGDSQQKELQ